MGIAREGYPLIVGVAVLSGMLFFVGWQTIGWLVAVLALAVAGFFRDPERVIPSGEGLVVSPADGKVVSIAAIDGHPLFRDAVTRVSIFLSPLDVHINRSPVASKVAAVHYQPGKFLAAYKAESTNENEQNALAVDDPDGHRFVVVQVAGVLARRIVCHVKQGDRLARGDRFGLIMFGSRTDTYLPKGCQVAVVEGQRVKGGETVLGRFL